jgi:hypothetical protein
MSQASTPTPPPIPAPVMEDTAETVFLAVLDTFVTKYEKVKTRAKTVKEAVAAVNLRMGDNALANLPKVRWLVSWLIRADNILS